MGKFDFLIFDDGSMVFNAKKYNEQKAIEVAREEWNLDDNVPLYITEEYCRHTVNGGFQWDNEPCYIICDKLNKGAFKVYMIEKKD